MTSCIQEALPWATTTFIAGYRSMTVKPIRVDATNVWLSSQLARIGATGWPERRGSSESGSPGRAAAAPGKWSAASPGERRLHEPILDLLEERTVRCPFRVPQARRRMHRRRDLQPLQLRPERVIIGMVQITTFEKHRPDEDGAKTWHSRHPLQFLQCEIHVLQRQYRGGEKPLRRGLAEGSCPVVVGAGQRVSHVRVAHQK